MEFVANDEVELDGHLIDQMLKMSDGTGNNNAAEKHLYVSTSTWYEFRDRVIYCHFPPGMWLDHCKKRSVIELLIRIGKPLEENVNNSDGKEKNAYVGLSFDDYKTTKFFIVREHSVAELEELIGKALAFVNDSIADDITCEVYVAPISTAQHRKDSWWSSKYVKFVRNKIANKDQCKNIEIKASNSYMHYRENIDDLIIQAVEKCVHHLELGKNKLAIKTNGLIISELCAGDGSLASKILQELQQCIGNYTLYERNKKLSNESKNKAINFKGSTNVKCVNIDVCSQEGEKLISNANATDIWIASGSVLCGQVGTMPNASSILNSMTNSLVTAGFLIITGFTQSFLTPKMIYEAGCEVVHGSLPTIESAGLESGFKRFHMFILKKKASLTEEMHCSGNKKKGAEYNKRLKQRYLLHT
jgi:hypothetical protein